MNEAGNAPGDRKAMSASSRMRARSGSVDSSDRLVAFLYVLGRDHMALGRVEEIMLRQVEHEHDVTQYSNGWLATWAQDVAHRLRQRPARSLMGLGIGAQQQHARAAANQLTVDAIARVYDVPADLIGPRHAATEAEAIQAVGRMLFPVLHPRAEMHRRRTMERELLIAPLMPLDEGFA